MAVLSRRPPQEGSINRSGDSRVRMMSLAERRTVRPSSRSCTRAKAGCRVGPGKARRWRRSVARRMSHREDYVSDRTCCSDRDHLARYRRGQDRCFSRRESGSGEGECRLLTSIQGINADRWKPQALVKVMIFQAKSTYQRRQWGLIWR